MQLAASANAAAAPGQCRNAEAPQQGTAQNPSIGAKPPTYCSQRMEHGRDTWTHVGTATETHANRCNQERGKTWDCQVVAVSKVGEGVPCCEDNRAN